MAVIASFLGKEIHQMWAILAVAASQLHGHGGPLPLAAMVQWVYFLQVRGTQLSRRTVVSLTHLEKEGERRVSFDIWLALSRTKRI